MGRVYVPSTPATRGESVPEPEVEEAAAVDPAELEELRERVAELESQVCPDPAAHEAPAEPVKEPEQGDKAKADGGAKTDGDDKVAPVKEPARTRAKATGEVSK